MTEQSVPAEHVIKIDPDGKYILVFPMRLTDAEQDAYRETVDSWWNGDGMFLMCDGGVQVIRLEKDGEKESKAKAET